MKTPFKCPVCKGDGTRQAPFSGTSSSHFEILTPCTACGGRGIVWGGDFEEETSNSKVSYISSNRIFGKNYLIDCARVSCFPDTEPVIEQFFSEIYRVLKVDESINLNIHQSSNPEEYNSISDNSSRISVSIRWSRRVRDFYLDAFSPSSFDEHLIREIILRFFEPDMFDDHIIIRRAPFGLGKKFIK
jgi:hypothetical protein